MPLELGSGQFIPGFEDQLLGAKAGDAGGFGGRPGANERLTVGYLARVLRAPALAEDATLVPAEVAAALAAIDREALLSALGGLLGGNRPTVFVIEDAAASLGTRVFPAANAHP